MISAIQTSDGTSGDNRGAKALVLVLAFFCASLHSKAPKAPFLMHLRLEGGEDGVNSRAYQIVIFQHLPGVFVRAVSQ